MFRDGDCLDRRNLESGTLEARGVMTTAEWSLGDWREEPFSPGNEALHSVVLYLDGRVTV